MKRLPPPPIPVIARKPMRVGRRSFDGLPASSVPVIMLARKRHTL
jgi:hypothetical protein